MLNFTQQLEEPFSQKQRTFLDFFIAFLKCALNLAHFEKRNEYSSLVISKVIDSERDGYLNVSKTCFRTPFGSQCVNGFQTLLK